MKHIWKSSSFSSFCHCRAYGLYWCLLVFLFVVQVVEVHGQVHFCVSLSELNFKFVKNLKWLRNLTFFFGNTSTCIHSLKILQQFVADDGSVWTALVLGRYDSNFRKLVVGFELGFLRCYNSAVILPCWLHGTAVRFSRITLSSACLSHCCTVSPISGSCGA